MIIDFKTLEAMMSIKNVTPSEHMISDSSYFVPSADWIKKDFHPWYMARMNELFGSFAWQEWRDCNRFAMGYAFLAQVCYGYGNKKREAESISIGCCCYLPDEGQHTAHAVNIALVDTCNLAFIEPQGPSFFRMSSKEINSIYQVTWGI